MPSTPTSTTSHYSSRVRLALGQIHQKCNLTPLIVWCETFAATSLYRGRDVAHQVGWPAYLIFTFGFAVAQGLGIRVAYGSTPGTGAGVGFAFFIASSIIAVFAARTPAIPGPRFFGNNKFLSRFWWVAFYPGHQLTRDLNVTIGVGKNWNIPFYWAVIMKVRSHSICDVTLALQSR
jgi:solute carrier family 6 GABA transporter-like protein 1